MSRPDSNASRPLARLFGTAYLAAAFVLAAGAFYGLVTWPQPAGTVHADDLRLPVAVFHLAGLAFLVVAALAHARCGAWLCKSGFRPGRLVRLLSGGALFLLLGMLIVWLAGPDSRILLGGAASMVAILMAAGALVLVLAVVFAALAPAEAFAGKNQGEIRAPLAASAEPWLGRLGLLTFLAGAAVAAAVIYLESKGAPGGAGGGTEKRDVVVYTALDREFSEPIFDAFTEKTGIRVLAKYDAESTKTVGLVSALIAERRRPRCDVFWNNEILHTLRLEKLDMLQSYAPPQADDFPAAFRSGDGTWHGFAARARILIVNTDHFPRPGERPRSIEDLADPRWKGKVGVAKPLFGTTATHAACLFAAMGPEPAKDYLRRLKANARILSGNKQVALAVAGGELAFGLTDTDDAVVEIERGRPVAIVYPDQGEGGLGTLFIPNTVSMIRGGPNAEEARALIEYLLSPEVETRLAQGPSAQIPLGAKVTIEPRVATPRTVKAMQVDFAAAARQWESAAQFVGDEFAGP
jgi:iron(III) transport system substrate-binding protein